MHGTLQKTRSQCKKWATLPCNHPNPINNIGKVGIGVWKFVNGC